jgi:hypothetical protein
MAEVTHRLLLRDDALKYLEIKWRIVPCACLPVGRGYDTWTKGK